MHLCYELLEYCIRIWNYLMHVLKLNSLYYSKHIYVLTLYYDDFNIKICIRILSSYSRYNTYILEAALIHYKFYKPLYSNINVCFTVSWWKSLKRKFIFCIIMNSSVFMMLQQELTLKLSLELMIGKWQDPAQRSIFPGKIKVKYWSDIVIEQHRC